MKTIREICHNYPPMRRRRGQSMVEMALIMPLFVLLSMGIIEFGWYVYSYSELSNAIRRGSEYASKSPPTTISSRDDQTTDVCAKHIKQKIDDYTFTHDVPWEDVRIVYPDKDLREIGVQLEVSLTYSGPWLTPLGNYLFDNQMPLRFSSRRTILNTAPPEGLKEGCIP
jgi:hypothetical protein